MLSEWNEINNSFNKFEKKTIMFIYIFDLSQTIKEGIKKDWKSINKKTYIEKCTQEINKINKIRLDISKQLNSINSYIKYIEELKLIDIIYEQDSLLTFMNAQNKHIKLQNSSANSQILSIKTSCKIIENTLTNTDKVKSQEKLKEEIFTNLRLFKFYVEIRVLNALIKCIAKGLNTLVVMFCMTEKLLKTAKGFDERLP